MKKIVTGVVIFVVAAFVLFWWFTLDVANVRPAAMRTDCANRLKQLILAMHAYQDVHGTLPPAVVYDENGKPMHSWRALILPYIEVNDVFEAYDFEQPWDSPNSLAVAERLDYGSFFCPELQEYTWLGFQQRPESVYTSYVAITGPGTAFEGDRGIRLEDFPDGTSRTVLLIEYADSDIQLLEPRDLTSDEFIDAFVRSQEHAESDRSGSSRAETNEQCELSRHRAGINVGLAGGSVRCVSRKTDPKTIRAITTNDGDDVAIDF